METLRQTGAKKGHIDTEIIICHRFVDYRDFFLKYKTLRLLTQSTVSPPKFPIPHFQEPYTTVKSRVNTLYERVNDIHGVWLVASKNIIPV